MSQTFLHSQGSSPNPIVLSSQPDYNADYLQIHWEQLIARSLTRVKAKVTNLQINAEFQTSHTDDQFLRYL